MLSSREGGGLLKHIIFMSYLFQLKENLYTFKGVRVGRAGASLSKLSFLHSENEFTLK